MRFQISRAFKLFSCRLEGFQLSGATSEAHTLLSDASTMRSHSVSIATVGHASSETLGSSSENASALKDYNSQELAAT
eukprot:6422857-Karenia_brevis.AAC.1